IRETLDTVNFNDPKNTMTAILDMMQDDVEATETEEAQPVTLLGKGATWHNMMGISNYREYQQYRKKHGSIKGMDAKLVAEIDGVTNGYIIKTLQMPLHKDYETHLQSGGVFVGERMKKAPKSIGAGEFIKDAKGTGGVYFKFKSFGAQAMDKGTQDNYAKPAKIMRDAMPGVLKSFGDNDLVKRTSELALNGDLGSADNGTLPAVEREYMKEPFMVFNYGAGISTILKTLIYGSVAKGAMDHFYDLVVEGTSDAHTQLEAIIRAASTGMIKVDGVWVTNPKATISDKVVDQVIEDMYTADTNLTFILPKQFEDNIASGVKAGLGTALETAFKPYTAYIEAGESINRSFQVMFRLFEARLDRRVAAAKKSLGRDTLTDEEMDGLIDGMAESMPAIKVALAEGEADRLMIYKEKSADLNSSKEPSTLDPKGKFKYAKKPDGSKQTVLYAKTKKRKLIESFASGSVIPIHFLDGSLMSTTLITTDSLGIHDALLVVSGKLKSTAKEYNRAVALLTNSYSLTTEVLKSFRDVINASDIDGKDIETVNASFMDDTAEDQDPITVESAYMDMAETQVKAEKARVTLLSKPIRYEQMAFEGGHFDWNMEGKAYVARTVDKPVTFAVKASTTSPTTMNQTTDTPSGNFDTELDNKLRELLTRLFPGIKLDYTTDEITYKDANGKVMNQEQVNNIIKVGLKVVEALNSLGTANPSKYGGTSQPVLSTIRLSRQAGITKKLAAKGVSKEQIEFMFEFMKQNDIGEISSTELAERVMFGLVQNVEVKTASDRVSDKFGEENAREELEYLRKIDDTIPPEWFAEQEAKLDAEAAARAAKPAKNSAYYSNLTVPGGINYREVEISIPGVIAPQQGHADFATANGIGWYRVDDADLTDNYKISQMEMDMESGELDPETYEDHERQIKHLNKISKDNKTLRVLEMQSDMFQGMKDVNLNTRGDNYANPFLQLLNTSNKWVKFFIQSIVQDAQKNGYRRVRFPTKETVSKVEEYSAHATWKEDNYRHNKKLQTKNNALDKQGEALFLAGDKKGARAKYAQSEKVRASKKQEDPSISYNVRDFYDIKVRNTLIKTYGKENVQIVEDENGNGWFELTLDTTRDSNTIMMQESDGKIKGQADLEAL
ncbi:MAG: hypothetical protein DRJ35_07710, partial [Thermoprotei archaeon]